MKYFASLLFTLALTFHLQAAEFAVITIQFPGEKPDKTVILQLFPEAAPQTVANFEKLARKKYYAGMVFHRALPNRLVQVGDPASKKSHPTVAVGTGGPDYVLPAEIKLRNEIGSVGMGRLPNNINPNKSSNGSQFYVCLANEPTLNGEYTVFGKITVGLDVLQAISRGTVDSNNMPIKRYRIRSIKIQNQ